ncbi:MAG: hypothetical protein IPG60_06520 [Bacteroidetes bacterium]|nr:hypothetical protein [Bacteroidota bacterium]
MIGSIRNPLDQTVSMYFKYKTDLDERFSSGRKRPGKWLRKKLARNRDADRYNYIQNIMHLLKPIFKFFHWPYSNWSVVAHKNLTL